MSFLEVNARRENFTDWLVICSTCRSKPFGWSLICVLPMNIFSFQGYHTEMQDVSKFSQGLWTFCLVLSKLSGCFVIFFPRKNVEIYLIHVDHIFKQIITLSFGMQWWTYIRRWTYIYLYTMDLYIYLYTRWTYIPIYGMDLYTRKDREAHLAVA